MMKPYIVRDYIAGMSGIDQSDDILLFCFL